MNILVICIGLFILILTFFDFFHTTFSGYGFGILSQKLNHFLDRIILKNKNRFIFKYSGLIHILTTAFMWLLLLLLGTFIIFISGDSMVVIAESKNPATFIERFYYICYLVSTVGIGDMVPGNATSRIFTAVLSFSGFILLTTSMTYLISVVNAVLQKKQLAAYISTLGGNIEATYKYVTIRKDLRTLNDISNDLRKLIIKNSNYYFFFPVIDYFLTRRKAESVELQLAILNEVLMVLRNNYEKGSIAFEKIRDIEETIEYYLHIRLKNAEKYQHRPEELHKLRQFWNKYDQTYQNDPKTDRAMGASLTSSGWSWKDVYSLQQEAGLTDVKTF